MSAATAQMNVRMPVELKEQGDDATGVQASVQATNSFEGVSQQITNKMQALGVDFSQPHGHDHSDTELLEMAYYDKMGEGLL